MIKSFISNLRRGFKAHKNPQNKSLSTKHIIIGGVGICAALILGFLVSLDRVKAENPENIWNMAGANPKRTSWVNQAASVTGIDWYRPIEAYIEQKVQIITANKKIYVSTVRGLLVLDAETGSLKWRFDTELPLANSPTVIDDMVYIGGYDRKIYAIRDLGDSYTVEWEFTAAKAGYSSNPLVADDVVYMGNRDGYFYAVNALNGSLVWQYPASGQDPLGPIIQSAAIDNGVIYFASNNMYAYALNAANGALVWQSPEKLRGEQMQGWWPVIYKDIVVFPSSTAYRHGNPGIQSLGYSGVASYSGLESSEFYDNNNGTIGTLVASNGSQGWPVGGNLLDTNSLGPGGISVSGYLNGDYSHRRYVIALDKSDGVENITVPVLYEGTTSGNRYPPLVDPADDVLYVQGNYSNSVGGIPRKTIYGWKLGNSYLRLIGNHKAIDEPSALSGMGTSSVLENLCCDREAGVAGGIHWWTYSNLLHAVLPNEGPEKYDPMWSFWDHPNVYERLRSQFGGGSINGMYSAHGHQNPLVPYVFENEHGQTVHRVFTHRSNTIIAIGTQGNKQFLPLIEINNSPVHTGTTLDRIDILGRLEGEMDKMVSLYEQHGTGGFLKPGYYNSGADTALVQPHPYQNPGDTLLALTSAYEHINPTLKTRTEAYMQAYYQKYFIDDRVRRIGWDQGMHREYMDIPVEVAEHMSTIGNVLGTAYPQRNFYPMLKYSEIFPDQASAVYQNAQALLIYPPVLLTEPPPNNPNCSTHIDAYVRPNLYNDYIVGYQSFLDLQELALGGVYDSGAQTLRNNIQNTLNDLKSTRASAFQINHPFNGTDNPDACVTGNQYRRQYNLSRNFLFMTPKLGEFFSNDVGISAQQAIQEYITIGALWFTSRNENAYQEAVMHHLYDAPTLFTSKAYVLGESISQLSKFIDVPAFKYGDVYYMQTLIAALDADETEAISIDSVEILTPGDIGKHEKFELAFNISNSVATNQQLPFDSSAPAGVDGSVGITVDVHFTNDNWNTIRTQPAFYYQKFDENIVSGKEWFYPTSDYEWRVRFSPNQTGTWFYRILAQDAGGSTISSIGSFNVVESSNKGFIRVSEDDGRYFEFEDGTYFPGLGYNMNYNNISWVNPTLDNQSNFEMMGQNGIQLTRLWLSHWGIFSSAWNPWNSIVAGHRNQYIPVTALTAATPYEDGGSETSMIVNHSYNRCMFIGWEGSKAKPAVKNNTDYRIRVRYKTQNIEGPRNLTYPEYGLVAKVGFSLGNEWFDDCNDGGVGQVVTEYENQNTYGTENEWQVIQGIWNSGSNSFLPNFYITVENVNQGRAFIDYVWIEEDLGGGSYGPNVVPKPWMSHHLYFEQRNSIAFDKVLELAEQHGIYLRPVLLEKNEWAMQRMLANGSIDSDNPSLDNFHGNYRNMTKVRWHQQSWWRYVQARWGYSPNIHSWELLNEGDPFSDRHYTLADEFGAYTKQFGASKILTTTSNWHSFPASQFWASGTYPNIDYATVHKYIAKDTELSLFNDTALASQSESIVRRSNLVDAGAAKPIIRGETGFTDSGTEPGSPDLLADSNGLWLHNFIWGGINAGGMVESYWYDKYHIYNSSQGFDHRPIYKRFYNFISQVPLNNGNYIDLNAQIDQSTNLRAWGQKDLVEGKVHIWISNSLYNWSNPTPPPETGTVSVGGFPANAEFEVKVYDTYNGEFISTSGVNADSEGTVDLTVTSLISDYALTLELTSIPGDPDPDPNIPPVASFTATPQSGTAPLQVNFNASASSDPDGTIVSYSWNFGDTNTGSGVTASHTYSSAGNYTATLTVTDNDGDTDQTTLPITVSASSIGPGTGFVIDRNSIELFEQIPEEYVTAARNLNQLFSNRSVGQNINEALDCLAYDGWASSPSSCRRDYYEIVGSTWNWKTFTAADLANGDVPDRIYFDADSVKYNRSNWLFEFRGGGWYELTENFYNDLVPNYINNVDVISYQFSYLNVDNNDTIADLDCGYFATGDRSSCPPQYRDWHVGRIEELEDQNPGKVFIYWTSSLARGIGTQVAESFNNQMRQYAEDNGKVLFDFADIISHTDTGAPCYDNRNGIEYCTQSGNCINHPDDGLDLPAICQDYTTETEGGHLGSVSSGKIRAAKAYWVLMACIAGWDGCGGSIGDPGDPDPDPNIPPVASFTATPQSGTAPLQVNFNASASSDPDGTIVSYSWNFGDTNTGSGVTASHTYSSAGNYTATLTVTDNDGDTDQTTLQVSVSAPPDPDPDPDPPPPPPDPDPEEPEPSSPDRPTVNNPRSPTYSNSVDFSGSKPADTSIRVNGNTVVSRNSSTLWSARLSLSIGSNSFSIVSRNSSGLNSSSVSRIIARYGMGDVNGDKRVDVFDLGILAGNYGKVGISGSSGQSLRMSDLNGDGKVDVFDLGIFAGRYSSRY
jgi:PKD repeat protein/outer membrane protein assembly factor BamB